MNEQIQSIEERLGEESDIALRKEIDKAAEPFSDLCRSGYGWTVGIGGKDYAYHQLFVRPQPPTVRREADCRRFTKTDKRRGDPKIAPGIKTPGVTRPRG